MRFGGTPIWRRALGGVKGLYRAARRASRKKGAIDRMRRPDRLASGRSGRSASRAAPPLVADRRRFDFEPGQAAEVQFRQDGADGPARQAESPRDARPLLRWHRWVRSAAAVRGSYRVAGGLFSRLDRRSRSYRGKMASTVEGRRPSFRAMPGRFCAGAAGSGAPRLPPRARLRAVGRRGTPVVKRPLAVLPEPGQPFVGPAYRDARRLLPHPRRARPCHECAHPEGPDRERSPAHSLGRSSGCTGQGWSASQPQPGIQAPDEQPL